MYQAGNTMSLKDFGINLPIRNRFQISRDEFPTFPRYLVKHEVFVIIIFQSLTLRRGHSFSINIE